MTIAQLETQTDDAKRLGMLYNVLYNAGIVSGSEPVALVRVPLAPSTNDLTTNIKNLRVKASGAKKWHQKAFSIIKRVVGSFTPAPHGYGYRLTLLHTFGSLSSFQKSDSDNRIKQCQDTLSKALGFDDSRIIDVRSIRLGVALFSEPSTTIILQLAPEIESEQIINLLEQHL